MKFRVTNEDIQKGVRSNINKCAVARCIARTLGLKSTSIMVNGYNITVKDKSFATPKSVADFIPAFDSVGRYTMLDETKKVRPFTFTLPVKVARKSKPGAKLVESKREYATA